MQFTILCVLQRFNILLRCGAQGSGKIGPELLSGELRLPREQCKSNKIPDNCPHVSAREKTANAMHPNAAISRSMGIQQIRSSATKQISCHKWYEHSHPQNTALQHKQWGEAAGSCPKVNRSRPDRGNNCSSRCDQVEMTGGIVRVMDYGGTRA